MGEMTLQEKFDEAVKFIQRVKEDPCPYAHVMRVLSKGKTGRLVIFFSGREVEVAWPADLSPEEQKLIAVGAKIRVVGATGAVLSVVREVSATGEIVGVVDAREDGEYEISRNGVTYNVTAAEALKPRSGDRVIMDASGSIILKNLGRQRPKLQATGVTWDDIGGLEEAKLALKEAIEFPYTHADVLKRHGRRGIKGVLLYGPPGTGKTMLGKAAASAMASLHGAKSVGGFHYVKGPEILNMFVGASEANVRNIFAQARLHKREHGFPAVVFIDEADAVLGKRESRWHGMEATIVPQFLSEMDGLEGSAAMVLLATNRQQSLDPAIVRDGRIDRRIKVPRPNKSEAVDIFGKHLRGVLVAKGQSKEELGELGAQTLYSSELSMYRIVRKNSDDSVMLLSDIASGSMIAGIVDDAVSKAIQRELGGAKGPHGMRSEDMAQAVASAYLQHRDMDHTDDIAMFTEGYTDDVKGVRRMEVSHG